MPEDNITPGSTPSPNVNQPNASLGSSSVPPDFDPNASFSLPGLILTDSAAKNGTQPTSQPPPPPPPPMESAPPQNIAPATATPAPANIPEAQAAPAAFVLASSIGKISTPTGNTVESGPTLSESNTPPSTTPLNVDGNDTQIAPEKITFFQMVKMSLDVFKKRLGAFIGLSFLNIAILGAIIVFIYPIIIIQIFRMGTAGIFLLVIPFLLTMILNWLFFGVISNQAAGVLSEQNPKLGESLSLTFKTTGKAINLAFKIFIYSGAWIAILIPLLSAGTSMANLGFFMVLITFVYAFIAGVVAIIVAIRMPYATFAFPVLTAKPDISAKEALQFSRKITKKKWFLVVLTMMSFSFLLGAAPTIIALIGTISGIGFLNLVAIIVSLTLGLLGLPLTLCFLQVFLFQISNPSKKPVLSPAIVIPAIILMIAPIMLSTISGKTETDKTFVSPETVMQSTGSNSEENIVDEPITQQEDTALTTIPETGTEQIETTLLQGQAQLQSPQSIEPQTQATKTGRPRVRRTQ